MSQSNLSSMIRVYPTAPYPDLTRNSDTSELSSIPHKWLQRFQGKRPRFACVLGFTETALIPGISAAGATPSDRQTTALADAEFLHNGVQAQPRYPLPPLTVGISPTFISRAVLQSQDIPTHIFDAGLLQPPPIPHASLGGMAARCVSSGQALPLPVVRHLFQAGLDWGHRLAAQTTDSYLIIGECVVAGTTTALGVLTGLGYSAFGKVNSSHPTCNHAQKQEIVADGLRRTMPHALKSLDLCPRQRQEQLASDLLIPEPSLREVRTKKQIRQGTRSHPDAIEAKANQETYSPEKIVAAMGDPMQPVVVGMAIAASKTCGVLLAGGTQMLAVYALIQSWSAWETLNWDQHNVVVGTTRWVTNDITGDTVSLAKEIGAPLMSTQLNFSEATYRSLQMYEQGFVKEGVGAGGCAIAATLYKNWDNSHFISAIEALIAQQQTFNPSD